jgi:hypothetical protein
MRAGVQDAEFKNSGDILLNNSGRVGKSVTPNGHGLNVLNYTNGKAAVSGLDSNSGYLYAQGMLGVLATYYLNAPVFTVNAGVMGIKGNAGSNGAGVYGWNLDANNSENYGGIFVADGAATSSGNTNYGGYLMAKYANQNIAGKFIGRVQVEGHSNVTDAPDYLSTVFSSRVNHTSSTDTRAVEGISRPADGYRIGVYGEGGYRGVEGQAYAGTYIGWALWFIRQCDRFFGNTCWRIWKCFWRDYQLGRLF